ncbi:MAG TPA: hypothetical protein VHC95_13675 [Opitutales bacterium]|nr:hypothetical protein [Opitutales bacterium]
MDLVSDSVGFWNILFMDLVAYSQKSAGEQRNAITWLTKAVAGSKVLASQPKPRTIYLPTGDGMAICFDSRPEITLELASELHRRYGKDRTQLRIGICSGVAFDIEDINGRPNLAGSGLNLAQRLLDCCNPGQILVSDALGEDLRQMKKWRRQLHGPYRFKVKHGQRVEALNFFDPAKRIGNRPAPRANRTGPR